MAEGVGFEPTVLVRGRQFSRLVHSTALPPLRGTRIAGGNYWKDRPRSSHRRRLQRSNVTTIVKPSRRRDAGRRVHGFLEWLCGDHGGPPAGGRLPRSGLRVRHATVAG